MMCFQQSDSWCLTLALPRVWLMEDEVSVLFPAQHGYGARMREKTFWMPSPYFIWHYRPLLTPPPPARPRLLRSCPLSIPASSLRLCTHPVLLLIVWVHCSLSSLASFLSWYHFLSHSACNYTHIRREEGAWSGRVNVGEGRKEVRKRVASIRVISVFFSWARTWVTSSLNCQWKRKNCQIVFPRCYAANCSESQEKAEFDYPSFPMVLNYVVLSCSVFSKLNTRNNCDNCLFLNKEPEWVWQFPLTKNP